MEQKYILVCYAVAMATRQFITKIGSFAILLTVSAAFSQEAIKFQIPTDASGNRPLNLVELSAKDTAGFETYSRRIAIVQDSISAEHRAIEAVKKRTESTMPKREPKGEFESTAEYETREAKWHKELFERTERDAKSHTARLADLEKAKKKIEGNQVLLYSSVNIKSNPEAASIWIGREEIGATPADYGFLIPGNVKITIRKEGYNPWDTTFQAVPGAKFKISAVLEEKSIFSPENEIDFVKVLSKDTTVEVYKSRIETIETRKAQVEKEIKKILEDFANSYTLQPQQPDETPDAFKKRRDSWSREGLRQVAELQRKHGVYKQKLERSVEVLSDYIIAAQSAIVSEPSFSAKVELGAYDADREQFELVAQDSASVKSPFLFKGKVGVPRDTAKLINRAVPGFVTSLQYINFPFDTGSGNVNLAMSKLLLSRNGSDLKVEGSFGEIMRYNGLYGYDEWKAHADSLLKGQLKPRGLDYAYAMGKFAAKDASAGKSEDSGDGLGWRGWTRIVAFTAAAALGGIAVSKHLEAQSNNDKMSDMKKNKPNPVNSDPAEIEAWAKEYDKNYNSFNDNQSQRNLFGGIAGGLAVAGIVTFFF